MKFAKQRRNPPRLSHGENVKIQQQITTTRRRWFSFQKAGLLTNVRRPANKKFIFGNGLTDAIGIVTLADDGAEGNDFTICFYALRQTMQWSAKKTEQ